MYCGYCGAKIPEGAKFCPGCGASAERPQAAGEKPAKHAAPNGAERGKRAGLIAGVCAAAIVLIALVCVFANMAQKKTAASERSVRSSWDEDDWSVSRRKELDEDEIGRREKAAVDGSVAAKEAHEETAAPASDGKTVPNPQEYLGEAVMVSVEEDYYCFGYWFEEDAEQALELTEGFSALLQEGYGLQFLGQRDENGEMGYYLAAGGDVHDLSGIDDDEGLAGCHVHIDILLLDDGQLLLVFYSSDLTVENFDPSAYATADEPQPEDTPEQTADPEPAFDPDSAVLPDLGIFLQCGRREDQSGYGGWFVSYSFDLDEGESVIDDVLDLMLEPQYQLEFDGHTEQDFISSSGMLFDYYYYTYTGDASIGQIDILGDTCQVQLSVAYYYAEGRIGVTLYFSNGFTLTDPGKRLKNPPTDFSGNPVSSSSGSSGSTGSNTPEFAKPDCSICHGTGKCTTCGGDGYLWSSAADKENRNCYACHNHDGKCTYCNGTGKR